MQLLRRGTRSLVHGVHVHAPCYVSILDRLSVLAFCLSTLAQPPMHLHTCTHTHTQYTHRVNPASGIGSLTARSSASLDNRRKVPADKLASDPNMARLAKYGTPRRASTKSASSDLSRNESDEGKKTSTMQRECIIVSD